MHSAIHIKTLESGRFSRQLMAAAFAACEPFAGKGRWGVRGTALYGLFYLLVFRSLKNFLGLGRAKFCATGAAPIPPKVFLFFRTMGIPLIEVYGQTESAGGITGHPLGDVRIGTVGTPNSGVEIRLADDGEILARGGMVFAGYYKDPALTAQTLAGGWLHTGDIGEWREGQIKIVDRKKDVMITSGGKNLSPSEIENAVKASPYIKECIVIGDGRKYAAALIQIDYENAGKWAEQRGIAFTTFRSLAEHPLIRTLIAGEVDAANAGLAPVEQIKRFHLLTKELDHDDGEVTATMKVRRASIYQKFKDEVEDLYIGTLGGV